MSTSGTAFNWKVLNRIMFYVKPFRFLFVATVVITVLLAVLAPLRPWLTQQALDIDIAKHDIKGLTRTVAFMFGVLLLQSLLQFVYTTLTNRLGQEVILSLRNNLFKKVSGFGLSYFDKTPLGITITRLVSDMETIADIFSDGLILIISDMLQVVVIIAVMFYIHPQLAAISLSTIPVLLIATRVFQKNIRKTFNDVRIQVAKLNEFVQEHLVAMRIVQLFNREEEELNKFHEINAKHRDANIRSIWYYSLFFPVVEILSAVSIGLIVWYGGLNVLQSSISLGLLVAFIQYINQLFRPIRELADKFNTLQMGMVSSERVFKLLDEPFTEVNSGTKSADNIIGKIEFRDVWFAYKNEEWILRGLSFIIPSGQSVAIVGSTGAGKTTIVSLINRLYEIQKGQILIDGVDIRDYDLYSLRNAIGVVLQDVFLFSDSIKNNITLYREQDDIVIEALLKQTGAWHFVEKLPGQLHYNPGERGGLISTGQRQLLSFARVLAHQPKLIILDEATSSVDSKLEQLLVNATEMLTKNRTSIIIAHRLSTIEKADRIIVLHKGAIAEDGNHQNLLERKGIYAHLHDVQFKQPSA
ncbi:MAG TPA: ABC transporter ATP-binding protein [Bacteroidia bacterium]|nr:ABC transporter ATP-binding protein [Bacteroidia bacterium]